MRLAAAVLFGLTAIKMAVVLSAQPMIGYANSYDYIRQESCVGLWQDYPDRPKTDKNWAAPVHRLVRDGDRRPDLCVRSFDNLFAHAVAHAHSMGSAADFRELGALRAIAILLSFGLLLFSVAAPASRLALSLAFHLIFGDIAYLSYFNTFYHEFSVIAGCTLSLAVTAVIGSATEQPRLKTMAYATLALIWLGLAKLQYSALASLLGLLCALVMLRRWSAFPWAAWLGGLGLALPLVYRLMNPLSIPISKSIDWCNKIDTFFWAVLPAASDPQRALQTLGLPASCQAAIGQSWYSIPSPDQPPCPEALRLGRASLVPLFVSQPRTFFVPFHRATLASRPAHVFYLGDVENPETRQRALYRTVYWTSPSTWLALLPQGAYLAIVYGAMLAGISCTAFLVGRLLRRRREVDLLLVMGGLGGVTAFYSVASSAFGDGYSEVAKHALGLGVGLAMQLSAAVVGAIRYTRRQ